VRVLLIDDDRDLLDLTTYALRREGFSISAAVDGQQGLQRWQVEQPDIVLLDVTLPKMNGFEVCRRIRQDGATPIIMLTCRYEDDHVVRGFQCGADDYVVKPFSARQLVARMRAVLRRCQMDSYVQTVGKIEVGDINIDVTAHAVTRAGRPSRLTPLEFRILYMLAMNAGRVVPYSRLVEYAWGYDGGDSNLLKTHISHVRRKLGFLPDEEGGIRAIPGVGYSLTCA
jgi:DNA-binding response OmpR family regulator